MTTRPRRFDFVPSSRFFRHSNLFRHSGESRNLRPAMDSGFSVILIFPVIPAKAGIYALRWTPLFAGMTSPYPNHPKRNTASPDGQPPPPGCIIKSVAPRRAAIRAATAPAVASMAKSARNRVSYPPPPPPGLLKPYPQPPIPPLSAKSRKNSAATAVDKP